MRPFAYERADDAAGAVALLRDAGPGARYLGGGTNLVDLMKLGVEQPARLVDVSRLPMDAVEELPGARFDTLPDDSLAAVAVDLKFLAGAQDVAVEPHRVLVVVGLDDQAHLQDAPGGRRHRGVGR